MSVFRRKTRAFSPKERIPATVFPEKVREIPRNTLCLRAFLPSHGANVRERRPDEGRRGQNAVSTLSDIMPPH